MRWVLFERVQEQRCRVRREVRILCVDVGLCYQFDHYRLDPLGPDSFVIGLSSFVPTTYQRGTQGKPWHRTRTWRRTRKSGTCAKCRTEVIGWQSSSVFWTNGCPSTCSTRRPPLLSTPTMLSKLGMLTYWGVSGDTTP